jgi:DNA repair protein RadC
MTNLYVHDASGFREAQLSEILERAHALLSQRYRAGAPVLSSPALTREFLRTRLAGRDRETFGVVLVDVRNRLIAVEELFHGTIDRASVHAREVVKIAIQHNASGLIAFHNHVTGVSEPSAADELLTRHLKEACALLELRLLDHFIIADPIYSFAEAGLI